MPIKRRIFQALLTYAQANRENLLIKKLDAYARDYHNAYENLNYNSMKNGEFFLVDRLYRLGNLECVFDVGANIGSYSKLVRSICNTCRIIAFEPVPSTFRELEENLKPFNVETLNCALGNFTGKAEIQVVPNLSELASLVEDMQAGGGRESKKIEIKVMKGTNFVHDKGIERISLLKVDTEGYDSEVLKGFEDTIKRADVVQFEYGKANLFSRYFLHDYFRHFGSDFYLGKLYPNGVSFFDKYHWDMDDLIGPNYVMVNNERPDIKSFLE